VRNRPHCGRRRPAAAAAALGSIDALLDPAPLHASMAATIISAVSFK
jgi:hypothetical protein